VTKFPELPQLTDSGKIKIHRKGGRPKGSTKKATAQQKVRDKMVVLLQETAPDVALHLKTLLKGSDAKDKAWAVDRWFKLAEFFQPKAPKAEPEQRVVVGPGLVIQVPMQGGALPEHAVLVEEPCAPSSPSE
jgi:hypothetical protein